MPPRKQRRPQTHSFDPALLELAKSIPPTTTIEPTLATLEHNDIPIDPALFAIEEVVNDVRRGKIKVDEELDQHVDPGLQDSLSMLDTEHSVTQQHQTQPLEMHMTEDHNHGLQLDDDGIDPALREIVNSLTNAQQSSNIGNGLTNAQAVAALGAHMAETDERDRLQQSLQTTLDDLAHANFSTYGSLFPASFHHSPTGTNLLLSVNEVSTSATPLNTDLPELDSSSYRRGRGRPRGSKNKPKPGAPYPPPQPEQIPRRPKGRPPKVRSEEEQAEFDRRKAEKEAGIMRKKGRPRKFPGFLVREMRLKRNREELAEAMRLHNEARGQERSITLDALKVHVNHHNNGQEGVEHPDDYPGWSVEDEHSLMDVVGVTVNSLHDSSKLDQDGHGMDREHEEHLHMEHHSHDHADDPSAQALGLGEGDEGMRDVFGLEVALDG